MRSMSRSEAIGFIVLLYIADLGHRLNTWARLHWQRTATAREYGYAFLLIMTEVVVQTVHPKHWWEFLTARDPWTRSEGQKFRQLIREITRGIKEVFR